MVCGKDQAHKKLPNKKSYLLALPTRVLFRKKYKIVIDGDCKKELKDVNNLCRFNHSCKPNCRVEKVRGPGKLLYAISITKKPIRPGQELVWDYGPGYWNSRTRTRQLLAHRTKSKMLVKCRCNKSRKCPNGRTCWS